MTKWIEYIGSDDQIAEILSAPGRFIVDDYRSIFSDLSMLDSNLSVDADWIRAHFAEYSISKYLICEPHPLANMIVNHANMIIRQARTGQPVWIRLEGYERFPANLYDYYWWDGKYSIVMTNTPDWNIPSAEYSFAPFENKS